MKNLYIFKKFILTKTIFAVFSIIMIGEQISAMDRRSGGGERSSGFRQGGQEQRPTESRGFRSAHQEQTSPQMRIGRGGGQDEQKPAFFNRQSEQEQAS